MQSVVTGLVKKVTLELIYNVVDERTRELKEDIKSVNTRIDSLNTRMETMNDTLNSRIDQIHTRLDQVIHMLADSRK